MFVPSSVITCEEPPTLANGRNDWDSQDDPEYGQVIEFTCNDGYTLVGPQNIVCSENGEYDSKPPTCEGKTIYLTCYCLLQCY